MTDTLEPAEFEPEDTSTPEPEPAEPDTPTDPPPERVGHMKWDAAKGVYVDPDPKHTENSATANSYAPPKPNATNCGNGWTPATPPT